MKRHYFISPNGLSLNQFHPQTGGIIKLDLSVTEDFIERFVRSKGDKDFKKFLRDNPSGSNLIDGLNKFREIPLINSLLFWLGRTSDDIESCFQRLTKIDVNLYQLLFEQFSHLYDLSYRDSILRVYANSKEIVKLDIKVKQSINFRKEVLNTITNISQKYYGLEQYGLLLGKRHEDLTIDEINGYILLKHGKSDMVGFNDYELGRIISKKKDSVIGWYHSHPNSAFPVYSNFDKLSHVHQRCTLSVYRFLKSLKIPSQYRFYLVKLSVLISLFNRFQIIFLLKAIKAGISKKSCRNELVNAIYQYVMDSYKKFKVNPHVIGDYIEMTSDKMVEILSNISGSFQILREKVEFILKKHNKTLENISFDVLPFVGLLICPQSRYIGAIDCSHYIDSKRLKTYSKKFFYYKINVY